MMHFESVIIGGGPAGTGPILKAMKDGKLDELLDRGIALIEKTDNLLKGSITNYKIHSDTLSDAFLECLEGLTGNYFNISNIQAEIDFIKRYANNSIPLHNLNQFLDKIGNILFVLIDNHPKCKVFLNTSVTKIQEKSDGSYLVFTGNKEAVISADKLLLSPGGRGIELSELNDDYGDRLSLEFFKDKIVHSDQLLKGLLDQRLKNIDKEQLKFVILGSSHSAFSVAYYLLNSSISTKIEKEAIKIYCNTKPKIFFATKDDAVKMNYKDFTDDDFCPVTLRLYRLAGLRMKSRDLFMEMENMVPGRTEERVALKYNSEPVSDIKKNLVESDLIIQALGYRFNIVPIFNSNGARIKLKGELTGKWVDDDCCLLSVENYALPNIYALGLASGFIPSGALGGEPSFKGQTNGIWFYQNILGQLILQKLLMPVKKDRYSVPKN